MTLLEVKDLNIDIKKGNHVYKKIIEQSFEVNEGDVILLSGPNGSGKSSIIKTLVGDTIGFTSLEASGDFYYFKNGKKIKINENDNSISNFVGDICYISQNDDTSFALVVDSFLSAIEKENIQNKTKYIFDFLIKYKTYNCFFDSTDDIKMNSKAKRLLNTLGIESSNDEFNKTALFLTSKKRELSGGQAKMLNILSNLIRIEFCSMCLIDEPLNNLDYSNVRLFSNIITTIHNEYPKKAFLIVTHCRSIPAINRIIQIDTSKKALVEINDASEHLHSDCSSCFGQIINGFYI